MVIDSNLAIAFGIHFDRIKAKHLMMQLNCCWHCQNEFWRLIGNSLYLLSASVSVLILIKQHVPLPIVFVIYRWRWQFITVSGGYIVNITNNYTFCFVCTSIFYIICYILSGIYNYWSCCFICNIYFALFHAWQI